jgi:hypothetical protein
MSRPFAPRLRVSSLVSAWMPTGDTVVQAPSAVDYLVVAGGGAGGYGYSGGGGAGGLRSALLRQQVVVEV